jgi:hypothetical protein
MSGARTRTTSAIALVAAVASALSCAPATREPAAGAAANAIAARIEGARRMRAIEESLAAIGYAPLPSRLTAEIAVGGRCSLSLAAAEPARIVAVAIGEPDAVSLDLSVESVPEGRELASDVSRGRRAAVSFAAQRGEAYAISASASAGVGTAVVAVFGAPLSVPPPPLATLFDADPAPRLGWSDVAEAARGDGYTPLSDPIDFDILDAAHRSFPFELQKDRCYTFVALGSPGVDAVALRVHGGAELLSADFAERYHAWARLCAEEDLRVRVSIDVAAGTGSARLGVFSAPWDDVAELVGPRILPAPRARTLEGALRGVGAYLERRGYGPGEALATARVEGAGTRVPIALPAGSSGCSALVAVAEDADADIDLEIVLERPGADGERFELADPSDGPDSRIAVCHGDDVRASATLISVRGAGRVGIARYPLPLIAIDAGGKEPPIAVREAAARLGRVGLQPAGSGASIRAKGGRCYGAIAFSPGGHISRLAVKERGAEEHATEWSGDSEGPEITWCAAEDGDYDLAATAAGDDAEPPIIILFASDK